MLFLIIELLNSGLRPHCVCLHKFLNHQHTNEFKAFVTAETKLTKKKQGAQSWSYSAQGQTQIVGFLFNVITHIMIAHFLLLSPSSSPSISINFRFKEYLQYLWIITNCSSLGEKRGVALWGYFSQSIYLLIIVGFLHWNNFKLFSHSYTCSPSSGFLSLPWIQATHTVLKSQLKHSL